MKKLLLLSWALLIMSGAVKSQLIVSTPTFVVTDTLHYYFNKFYFKTGVVFNGNQIGNHPALAYSYKSPAATNTNITHMGNIFENCDTIQVTGLEGFATRNISAARPTIEVRLYLCGLDNQGKPKLPPIDSVITLVTGGQVPGNNAVGGPFPQGRIRTVTGNFAVLIRNVSTITGDTVRVFRTAAKSYTNNNVSWDEKYSDSYGYVRWNGNFYSTRDYTLTPGFGLGTDYEFLVAPIVKYNLWAAHEIPKKIVDGDPLCTFECATFTNYSSKLWTHRMYNLNSFYVKWRYYGGPFLAQPQSGSFPNDSAITWFFEPNDGGPMGYMYLPACGTCANNCSNKICFYTARAIKSLIDEEQDSVWCFPDCQFRARFTGMAIYGRGQKFNTTEPNGDSLKFTLCTQFCNNDNVGIKSESDLKDAMLYPNPSGNGSGMVTLSGLNGRNDIYVYNITGQTVQTLTSDNEKVQVDLRKQVPGNYFIRVVNTSSQRSRIFKVVRD